MLEKLSIQPCAFLLLQLLYLCHAVLCLAQECLSETVSKTDPESLSRAVGARVINVDAAGVLGVHALLQFGISGHLRDCSGGCLPALR